MPGLDEAILERLAAPRRKPDTIPRAITGALNQVTFPSLEKRKKPAAPMTLPSLTGPVMQAQPEPMAPEPAPMDEFDMYAANTQGGGW